MSTQPERAAGVADADLGDATALVTGSTSGIGRETALALGRLGAHVLVHGRDAEAGRAVTDDIDDAAGPGSGEFVAADFAEPEAVAALADAAREAAGADGLDLLVNNAGGYFREGRLTDLGVEYTFHVNHLGPYQLTAELLGDLAGDARIVTTASEAHRGEQVDLDAVRTVGDYSGWRAYQRSKLANVQFAAELGRRLDAAGRDVTSNSFHPGAIPGSGFVRNLPGPLPKLAQLAGKLPFATTPADGAATAVYLGVADAPAGVTGRYFADCEERTPSRAARDRRAQRRLWEVSADLLGRAEPLADAGTDGVVRTE